MGGNLDGHLILYVFLPILIFEAGFALDVHTFKKSFLNAFYLAGPGIVTATVMSGMAFMVWCRFLVGMRCPFGMECRGRGLRFSCVDAFRGGGKCD